ncbi:MAG: DNA primase [Eubacterium sp.]|nr:DNA primase [Eubacterium sp.]
MRYSSEIIEEVREKNDIIDVIGQYVHLKRTGSNYMGLCPFHSEKSPSFSVSQDKQLYHCFGCGASGNVYTFVMNYDNCSFTEAIRQLADRAGVTLPEADESPEERKKDDERSLMREANKEAARYFYASLFHPSGKQALDYLHGRGLSNDTIACFGLGYSGKSRDSLYRYLRSKGFSDSVINKAGLVIFDEQQGPRDRFFNRVMYPIMDASGRFIGFGGRVMGDAKPKYLNTNDNPVFNKRLNLYGLNFARRSRKDSLIICEGYMDVISMHQAGFTNAVASLGTALTEEQCALMRRFAQKAYVIYDMDGPGVNAAMRAIPMMRTAGIETRVVNLRPHKDPDEFIKAEGKEAFEERLKNAENSFFFILRMRESAYDMNDPQGKADFLREAAKRIFALDSELERDSYIEATAARYQVNPEILRRAVGEEALAGTGKKMVQTRNLNENLKKAPVGNSEDQAQKLMLTWLVNMPYLIGKLENILGPEDFTTPLYHEVAELIYKQAAKGKVDPAAILDNFQEAEEQNEAASLFHARLTFDTDKKDRLLTEILCRIKEKSLDKRLNETTDMTKLQELIREKQKVQELKVQGLPKGTVRG